MMSLKEERLPSEPFASQGGVVVLAHRGWRGLYPENTMLSFEKAATLPIDGLEIDIHQTKDGVIVVAHDDTVDRMTDGQGPIRDYTLAQLQELDAGYRFSPNDDGTFPFRGEGTVIPTLEEVFRRFGEYWINVDIKQHEPSMVQPFADMIRDYGMAEKMCVGSFDTKTVHAFRQACPEVARSASYQETMRLFLLNKVGLGRFYWGAANVLQIPEASRGLQVVTPRFVRAAHRNRVAVHVWTVNETAVMQRLIDWGVDGIITDFPDRALRLLERIE